MNATGKSAGIGPDRRYDDMLGLPHHVSKTRPRMSPRDRAAQFAPFAALSGHKAVIQEAARLTERRVELSDTAKDALGERFRLLGEAAGTHPEVTVTYFRPDGKKAGGAYVRVSGAVKKIDACERTLVLCVGAAIPVDDVIALEGALFESAFGPG